MTPGTPSLSLSVNPAAPPRGSAAAVTVLMQNVTSADYTCLTQANGTPVANGTVTSANPVFQVTANEDLTCTATAVGPTPTLSASADIDVDCGNQIRNSHSCRDFSCTSVVAVTASQLTSIPARDASGVCYAYKIMSQIPYSASSLTNSRDANVLARSHDVSGTNANPYQMASVQGQFKLLGPRVVKLAGNTSATQTAGILVDNFVLTGVYPDGSAPDYADDYQVRGTADSSLVQNGAGTGVINVYGVPLKLTSFGSSGTATVAPINLTVFAAPNVLENFDVRALDCGKQRQLSDVYLLFQ